ncbi:group III truncated hemoglobin [Halpernia sp.]|uniref:group III truncated hemoglobin n=1 Tax=Halpernia sp. TaxID=2782209 RepID=UPI003A94BD8B
MKKLETREDVEFLVNKFYEKVRTDETIGFFFNDVAKVNWDLHLPKMYSFWETLLFGKASYKGNPMMAHFPINQIEPMEKRHFDQWVKLWTKTLEENFEGENAEAAKTKAENIASLMGYKMEMARR